MPFYVVVGCGDSMIGAPIQAVQQGIQALHTELLSQPEALEQVWISLITFADRAEQLVPLTSLTAFSCPFLKAGGGYNLGAGLRLLLQRVHQEVKPGTDLKKGDYRPLIFLLFDNEPTDPWERELAALKRARQEARLGDIIAVGLGNWVNLAVLRQITPNVLKGAELTPETLLSFFRWTSASVTTVSQSIAAVTKPTVTLPAPPVDFEIVL
jgi:uncharacterized protein YegL